MKWIKYIAIGVIALFLIFWFATGYSIKAGQKPVADGSANYAIVLGAKVKANGEPSKALKYRLDAAYDYAIKYSNVQLILSGGQGVDEKEPEAISMKNYLINRGIDSSRLILETESTSTYENTKYSALKIPLNQKKITIISNDFHLARAKMIAENLGFSNCDVVAATTPKSVEFKLISREKVGLVLQRIQLWR